MNEQRRKYQTMNTNAVQQKKDKNIDFVKKALEKNLEIQMEATESMKIKELKKQQNKLPQGRRANDETPLHKV